MTHPPKQLTWGALALSVLSLAGSLYFEYKRDDRDLVQRVSALEAHQVDNSSHLERIEQKIDRLVDWALGSTGPR